LSLVTAILPTTGRVAISQAIKNLTAHLAIGRGNAVWTTPPVPSVGATGLIDEIARRKATEIGYVIPSPTGDIITPNGAYVRTATVTRFLYFRFAFETSEALGQTIREQAIFLNTTLAVGVSESTFYLLPAQVANQGLMLVLQNSAPIVRSPTTRNFYEHVISF